MLGDPCVVSVVLWVIPLLITCAKLPVKCQIYCKIHVFSFFFSRVRTHKYVNQNGKPYILLFCAIKQYGNLIFKIFETSAYLLAYIYSFVSYVEIITLKEFFLTCFMAEKITCSFVKK